MVQLSYSTEVCLTVCVISVFLMSTTSSIHVPKSGVLKMCPPGGETFTGAWQITCGMRKKRDIASAKQGFLAVFCPQFIYHISLIENPSTIVVSVSFSFTERRQLEVCR
ncbi:unnamed protein product [Anisakis simplex]|uniref:Secreted protein n=1 Tax=Anisakis simplex TaxID=6269 RepID=A0A0M3KDP2_ANISI|nr:unnamed protein product [Anisakis simplex]